MVAPPQDKNNERENTMNENMNPVPTPQPRKPIDPKLKKGLIIAGAALAAFVVGIAVGSTGDAAPMAAPAVTVTPEPAPTVTVTPEPVEVEVPGKTEVVEKAPQVCFDALDLADDGLGLAAETFGIFADSVDAILSGDWDAVDAASAKIAKNNDKIDTIAGPYQVAKAACRAG
jgi:hypothetical protein